MKAPAAEPVAVEDLWELGAEPWRPAAAAAVWRDVAADARAARETLDRAAAPLAGAAWAGPAAESYQAHRGRLGRDLEGMARAAADTAAALDGTAALLRRGQAALDDAWARLAAAVPHERGSGGVTLRPAGAAQVEAVRLALADATAIRSELDDGLRRQAAALAGLRPDWSSVARGWAAVAADQVEGWLPPAEADSAATTITTGTAFVVGTGPGDDLVVVGERTVTVNGVVSRIPAGTRTVIRTGGGDDAVLVTADGPGVTVLAGAGDDRISGGPGDDVLIAGAGSDTVLAGPGDDRVSLGSLRPGQIADPSLAERAFLGAGDDRLWGSTDRDCSDGGAGDDLLFGGAGDDDLEGGDGADTIDGGADLDHLTGNAGDDFLTGGAERDYLDGGPGDDTVDGGSGDDTLYGGRGDDVLRGGAGADYLEGGRDNDRLDGGAGADILDGGRGDDTLDGGPGDDVLYSGPGRDTVTGGAGDDRLSGQGDDAATGVERLVASPVGGEAANIVIEGDEEFRDRVEADLDLLRSSPAGRQLLAGLRPSDGLTIREAFDANGYADRRPSIAYNPAFDRLGGGAPPVVVLFHELAHVYDFGHGTANQRPYNGADGRDALPDGSPVPNFERQAVGLPIDDDGDPATANRVDPRHPLPLTENGLRQELGLRPRETYGSP